MSLGSFKNNITNKLFTKKSYMYIDVYMIKISRKSELTKHLQRVL